MSDLVVISLEKWDHVWRRNQHLISRMLRLDPTLRVMFVEPSADPLHTVSRRQRPRLGAGLSRLDDVVGAEGRLWTFQATKWLPRSVDARADERLAGAVMRAARRIGFRSPALWVNDPSAAALMLRSGWPALYDMTDDWVEAERPEREHERLIAAERTLFDRAREVVACSPALQQRKAAQRPAQASPVRLLGNAVDLSAYAAHPARPADLPPGPVALYAGTVHLDRIDLEATVATAAALRAAGATLTIVGPAPLPDAAVARLRDAGAALLGSRPHDAIPAYLCNAELLVVPHVVDDFTQSLDPIKAYEYRAAARPVLSTAVAGFADSGDPRVRIVAAHEFAATAVALLTQTSTGDDGGASRGARVPDWEDRAQEMAAIVERVRAGRPGGSAAAGVVAAAPFDGVIVQAAPRIEPGAGVAGVAAALEAEFVAAGIRTERFTLDEAHGGWIPRPTGDLPKRLALIAEVVWFSLVGGALLRRRSAGDAVVVTHNDALGGDVYVNHGVLKAALQARGRFAARVARNPLHVFVLARDAWRYRSRTHRAIVALTPGEERTLRAAYPRLAPPVTVISNGVDTRRFAPPTEETAELRAAQRADWQRSPDDRVVLFVGHEYDRKGLPLLIAALPRVPGCVVVVVGGSPEMVRAAERDAQSLGVADRVSFIGQVRDPVPYFRAADVFCLPSAYEANALVVLEALASGLPVVATRVGFAPELIDDGVNGFLVDRTVDDVVRALTAVTAAELAPWRRAARATGERYAWSVVARRYADLAAEVRASRAVRR
ncbi:glycosyltransferase [Gryllotalpicola reticulitermitis]|uniref:Glycosyltransferase n=1 Tax=Gryllotalpicola reticulitermitis TaxID=1184153 RepID=A0ABV8Q5R2_9MICO